jgi:hypothetical protein
VGTDIALRLFGFADRQRRALVFARKSANPGVAQRALRSSPAAFSGAISGTLLSAHIPRRQIALRAVGLAADPGRAVPVQQLSGVGCATRPFSELANGRKLTDEELVRAIRFMVASEYEATQMYMQLAESTENKLAVAVLKDIADEERVHAGEFLKLLYALAPDEEALYAKGGWRSGRNREITTSADNVGIGHHSRLHCNQPIPRIHPSALAIEHSPARD